MKNNKNFEIFLLFIIIILVHSYIPTVKETISDIGSADFNWQPTKCVFEGINHYTSYLIRDGTCPVFYSQNGEYAQGLYILLYPFTLISWDKAQVIWMVLNITLLFFTIFFMCKRFELNKFESLFIFFLVFYVIVTRVHLIMGQHTILALAFMSLPFIWKSNVTYILSGISYFKYNIGYALFLLFVISKKYKILFLSLMPCITGWLIYSFITDTHIFENLFQPLKLTFANLEIGNTLNNPFLFSFIRNISFFSNYNYFIIFILSILFNLYMLSKIKKITDDLLKLSLICILVLISTPHWGHDNVLLIPFLIYSVKNYNLNLTLFRFNLFFCIYFLHLYKGVQMYFIQILLLLKFDSNFVKLANPTIDFINIIILLTFLILNLSFDKKLTNK